MKLVSFQNDDVRRRGQEREKLPFLFWVFSFFFPYDTFLRPPDRNFLTVNCFSALFNHKFACLWLYF